MRYLYLLFIAYLAITTEEFVNYEVKPQVTVNEFIEAMPLEASYLFFDEFNLYPLFDLNIT